MRISRRLLLPVAAGLAIPAWSSRAAESPDLTERALGKPDAPVSVIEFFSLTCPHCADFQRDTLPRVQSNLIDPGKLYYIFWDFPLDRVALLATMIARALPPERYEPFINALLETQDRWAFARGVNSAEELGKMAALAGMSSAEFNKAAADNSLRDWILKRQDEAVKEYGVDSTPSFVFNGKAEKNHRESGSIGYDAFAKAVAAAAG
jgi:protein-disulfide isomerase